jgi:hypothetical protein
VMSSQDKTMPQLFIQQLIEAFRNIPIANILEMMMKYEYADDR